jgi:hypothetical protein
VSVVLQSTAKGLHERPREASGKLRMRSLSWNPTVTDSTIEIVKEYTEKIYYRPYQHHGTQINYALDECSFDWAFCIDSDEAIDNVM